MECTTALRRPTPCPADAAYRLTEDEVLERFGTRREGLTSAEVLTRRAEYGDNVIVQVHQESLVRRFLRQFKDWIIVLLLICAAITAYLGDVVTSIVLLLLVLLNTSIGFFQEYRSGKTMDALQHLSLSLSQVTRDGRLTELDSTQLVVGDVVRLTEGASVPADIRLIETSAFSTNEFALTGESDPTRKYTHAILTDVVVAERHNTAHAGTTVATGEAVGIVVSTGIHSELGRIAQLAESAPQSPSPLQREMQRLGKVITYAAVILALVLLVVAVWAKLPFREAVLFAVGFASAVIPQGLPAEVNTALADAAAALAKRKALVKRLSAVETLGSTQVICTDKTGTLTKNEMTVTELVVAGTEYVVHGIGYEPVGDIEPCGRRRAPTRQSATDSRGSCARAHWPAMRACSPPDEDHAGWHILGDPTEGALLAVAAKAEIDLEAERTDERKVREFPFDSARKLMTAIRERSDGTLTAYVKGAPESVVARASRIDGRRYRPTDHGCRPRGVPRGPHREVRPRPAQSRLRDPAGHGRGRRDDRPGVRRDGPDPARTRLDGRSDPRRGARCDAPGAGCPHPGEHRHGRLLAHGRGDRARGGTRPERRADDRHRRRTGRDERRRGARARAAPAARSSAASTPRTRRASSTS